MAQPGEVYMAKAWYNWHREGRDVTHCGLGGAADGTAPRAPCAAGSTGAGAFASSHSAAT